MLVLLLGIIGGVLSGFFGVSGGVVITPSLCFLGIPPMTAISSQLNNALATDLIGFLGCLRKGAVDIVLAFYILVGGIIGAWNEQLILKYLKNANLLDSYEKNIPLIFTLFIGMLAILSICTSRVSSYKPTVSMKPWMMYLPFHKVFIRSRAEISIIFLIFLGWITGVLTATLGGGNSLILIPILTYVIGRVSSSTTGTSFLAGIGIITAVILFHAEIAHYDPMVSFFLILGTSIGSPIGQELAFKRSKQDIAKKRSIVIVLLFCMGMFKIFYPSSTAKESLESYGFYYALIGGIGSILLSYFLEKTISRYLRKKVSEL